MMQISTKKRIENEIFLWMIKKWLDPPMKKIKKSKNIKHLILIKIPILFLMLPVLLKEYNLFSQSTDSSHEQ